MAIPMRSMSALLAVLVAFLMAGSALAVEHETPGEGENDARTQYTLLVHSDGSFTHEEEAPTEEPEEEPMNGEQDQQQQDEQLQEQQEENPTLTVPADQQITVTIRLAEDATGQHSFCVETEEEAAPEEEPVNGENGEQLQQEEENGEDCSETISQAGDEATLTFMSPSEGTMNYWNGEQTDQEGQIQVHEEEVDPVDPVDPFDPEAPEPEPEEEPTPAPAIVGLIALLALGGLWLNRRRSS